MFFVFFSRLKALSAPRDTGRVDDAVVWLLSLGIWSSVSGPPVGVFLLVNIAGKSTSTPPTYVSAALMRKEYPPPPN